MLFVARDGPTMKKLLAAMDEVVDKSTKALLAVDEEEEMFA